VDAKRDVKGVAAKTYAATAAVVVAFQLALAVGAPWGAFAMGGSFPGQYPPIMRMGALMQALLILMMTGVVLARAGLALPRWSKESRWLIWLVVGLGGLTLLLNLISPSPSERLFWIPVAVVQLVSGVLVAIGK
jgi:hypothetical protein